MRNYYSNYEWVVTVIVTKDVEMEQIINDMKILGLNEYEIKAYLSLLSEYPVNGYNLSKSSGIPRSRIYEVLENLKNKQIVFEEQGEKAVIYYPIEPALLIEKMKSTFGRVLENVDTYTRKLYSSKKIDNNLTVIKGTKNIIDFSNLLISQAVERISLFLWDDEMPFLQNNLDEAIKRGVVLKGIYFGQNNPFKELVIHRRINRYLSEKKERHMIIAIDTKEVLSGIISRGDESQVTWTKDRGFVRMGEDYIEHDLMINLYAYRLTGKEKDDFEQFVDEVRKEYSGFTEEQIRNFQ